VGQVAEHHAPLPASLDDAEQEARVARQAVELGDQQRRTLGAAGSEGGGQLRPVRPLAALDLLERGGDLPTGRGDVAGHRLALRLETEAGAALAFGADPAVGDEAHRPDRDGGEALDGIPKIGGHVGVVLPPARPVCRGSKRAFGSA
jgi:hypothetical protein